MNSNDGCSMHVQVYPEYYEGELQGNGIEIYGKRTDNKKSRMFLSEDGQVRIFYDKIKSNGWNEAGCDKQKIEIFKTGEAAIGLGKL